MSTHHDLTWTAQPEEPSWLDTPDTERRPGRYALLPGPGPVEHLHPLGGWPPPAAEEEAAPSTERSPASEPLSERDRGRERIEVGVVGAGVWTDGEERSRG